MSDALLRLIQPYVDWPPAADEITELEEWLALGAAVWNATVQAHSAIELREKLRSIVDDWEFPDEDEPLALVEELAARKLRLLADDYRLVGDVHIRVEGGRANVQALSLAYLR